MGPGVGLSATELEHRHLISEGQPFDRSALERVIATYLRALGVYRREESEPLIRQVTARVELRAALGQIGEPAEAAVEETHQLLDQWLIAELALENDPDALSAARAAVLGGDVPGWTARWAGLSADALAESIREARVWAVPESAPLRMEPSPIQLCCRRGGLRLLARVGRLLVRRRRSSTPAG